MPATSQQISTQLIQASHTRLKRGSYAVSAPSTAVKKRVSLRA